MYLLTSKVVFVWYLLISAQLTYLYVSRKVNAYPFDLINYAAPLLGIYTICVLIWIAKEIIKNLKDPKLKQLLYASYGLLLSGISMYIISL